eukprot:g6192.t1
MILRVLFHPNEAQLVSSAMDGSIRVWNLRQPNSKINCKGHVSAVTCLAFAQNGRYLISSGRDNVVIIWSILDGSKCVEFPVFESIEDLICLPNSAFAPSSLLQSNVTKKTPLFVILTGGARGCVRIWRSDNGSCILTQTSNAQLSEITKLGYLEGSNQLFIVRGDCSIEFSSLIEKTVDEEDGSVFGLTRSSFLIGNLGEITDIAFLNKEEDSQFAISTNSPNVFIFSTLDLNCRKILSGHEDSVLCLVSLFIGNEVFLVSGSKDQTIRVWNVETGAVLSTVKSHGDAVTALVASQRLNGSLISVSGDKIVKSWQVRDKGVKLKAISGIVAHSKDINCVDLAPNDHQIATGSMDKTIKIFNLPNLVSVMSFKGHQRGVWSVEFSKFDKTLLSSSADLTIKIWSLTNASCLRTFEGHSGSVTKAHFISNSMQIISCAGDGMIKLWNVKNCENIATFDEHEDRVWSIEFQDHEENLMVSGGSDSQLIVWENMTEKDKELEIKSKQEELIKSQELENAIRLRDYALAAELAFSLEHPRKLLSLLKTNLDSNERQLMFSAIVGTLDDEVSIKKCLEYIRDWNTNAKHCEEAQVLLKTLLETIPPRTLIAIPKVEPILLAIESYSQRHFNRLQKLNQSAYLVDYTLDALNVLDEAM